MSLVLRSLGGDGATFPVSLATAPPGEWILATPAGGPHYFIRCSWRDLAEGELPDRTVLDRAAPGHPIFSQAWERVVPVTERQSLSDPPGGTALVRAASTATGCGHLLLDGPEAEGAVELQWRGIAAASAQREHPRSCWPGPGCGQRARESWTGRACYGGFGWPVASLGGCRSLTGQPVAALPCGAPRRVGARRGRAGGGPCLAVPGRGRRRRGQSASWRPVSRPVSGR